MKFLREVSANIVSFSLGWENFWLRRLLKKALGLNAGGGEDGGISISAVTGWGMLGDSMLLCLRLRLHRMIKPIARARKTAIMTPTAIPAFAPEERPWRERG